MNHLTQEQRYVISEMKSKGYLQKEIAKVIGKDKSTISRELRRNCDKRNGNYDNELAQRKSENRQRLKPRAIKFTDKVRKYVELKLKEKWSPEQISKTPTNNELEMVSHERIYQHIIIDKRAGGELWKNLRRRKKYKRHCVTDDRRGKLANTKSIHDRPQEADQRSRLGDLEVDLIIGADHKGGLLTINDRTSGVAKIRKIKGKNAKMIAKQIIAALRKEKGKIHTITSDNGKEFAEHEYISEQLGIDFYFADPYSSWQRGSNENLNGLIRQYFPKKTNFDDVTIYDVKKVEKQINKRPRKRYGFRSPIEEYNLLTEVAFAA